ncbi:MAG TPA: (2Fe-2S)-binding protein [Candidatus Eremiobacteraceae bacterium]
MNRRRFVVKISATAFVMYLGLRAAARAARSSAKISESRPERLVLHVNGAERTLEIDPRVTLLDALRDHLGLTGTKKGCDQGTCGACTVHVNGRRINSCLTLAMMHAGDEITTIEGIADHGRLHPIQAAFIKHDGFQCGYCTSGQIMSAIALLNEGHSLDRETIQAQMSGNLCRCGCYPHIVDAIADGSVTE